MGTSDWALGSSCATLANARVNHVGHDSKTEHDGVSRDRTNF